jgi:integrase
MKTHNAENERIKREYFVWLKEAQRYNEQTIDGVAKALNRFETYTRFKDFKLFHKQQAVAFKHHLGHQLSCRSGERLSKATLYSTLTALKRFFHWLAGQRGYKSLLSYSDSDYFNLSEKDTQIAKAHREQRVPTVEQIKHVLDQLPATTSIERRNRALIAFTLLTGARDGAIASLKLKHLDVIEGKLAQDAREVDTKFSKTFTTIFFPVGDDIRQIVVDWAQYLKEQELFGLDDPLFPATAVVVGSERHFVPAGLEKKHWATASPIREIFKQSFTRTGLPYFNPHSFRKTLVRLAMERCRTPEEFKAWSQNLGHEQVMTTFSSYGQVGALRQAEIIRDLGKSRPNNSEAGELAKRLAEILQSSNCT